MGFVESVLRIVEEMCRDEEKREECEKKIESWIDELVHP